KGIVGIWPLDFEIAVDNRRPCLRWIARYSHPSVPPSAVDVRLGALAAANRSITGYSCSAALLMTPENPAYQLRLSECLRRVVTVFVANTWWLRAWPEACVQLASRADLLFVSESEAHELTEALLLIMRCQGRPRRCLAADFWRISKMANLRW